ncbi:MAG: hypothetical protein ACK401_00810 [Archaeoglobaceae archaeon]
MEGGKLSLDLLIGLSIFLFTFIFVASFLPSIFADVRSEINLAHQAYRVSALLVEDPGYPSDWAEMPLDSCTTQEFRVGLIILNMTKPGPNKKEYNHIDFDKAKRFSEFMVNEDCRGELKKYLGLNLRVAGSPVSYGLNVSLKNMNGSLLLNDSQVILNNGDIGGGAQVMRFERIVYLNRSFVDNCEFVIGDRCIAKLEVRVWI